MTHRQRACSKLIILFFLAFWTNVQAQSSVQPTVSIETRYYPVQGTTSAELHEQMNRLGPLDPLTGKRFSAYTRWYIHWYYRTGVRNNRCRLESLQVKTDVIMTLPRWISPVKGSRSLRDQWDQFINALIIHENGHKEHGILAGQKISQLLTEIPPQLTCAEVADLLTRSTDRILQTYIQADIQYDRLTQHGRTQGAILP